MLTERDKQIIDLYLYHPELSNKQIAEQFNVSVQTISRIARINNLPRRKGNSGTRLSVAQEKELEQKYLQGIPLLTLQKEYNISYNKIKNILKNCDNVSCAKRLNPNLIEDYFEKIDSDNKAYWLGWIVSDGSITNQPNKSKFQLELTIKQEDEDILHLLEQNLQVTNKVYTSEKIYKRFSLGCKKIVLDLEKLGITQNKSFTVKVPSFNPIHNAAFIRGLFDGDGGFSSYTRSNGQHCNELSFCGNEYVVTWVLDTLLKEIPELSNHAITKEGSIKRVRWSGKKDLILLRDFLYKNHNNHYLKRKHDLIYANTEVSNQIAKG